MRTLHIVLVMCLTLAIAGTLIGGQMSSQSPRASVQIGPVVRPGLPQSGDVFIGQEFAFRIASPAGGLSPMQRGQIVADRLNQAFDQGASWEDLRVSQVGGLWAVTIDSTLIATADVESARAMKLSTGTLASRWARQTVVALGGQPQLIAMQLEPVPARVAGAREEIAVIWATSPTKSVPLLNATDGAQMGTVIVAGAQEMLDRVNAVVVYETASQDAVVRAFVPITGTTVTDQPTRVLGVGLVSISAAALPMTGFQMGAEVSQMITDMGTRWNSFVNSWYVGRNWQLGAATKVVPVYWMDQQGIIGAAQVVGPQRGINQAQGVVVTSVDNMSQLRATAAQFPPTDQPSALTDVVVSALLMVPEQATEEETESPEETAPSPPGMEDQQQPMQQP